MLTAAQLQAALSPPATPVQRLQAPLFDRQGVEFWVKRDDLIDAEIPGNKWRKLKYNLIAARQAGYSRLLTFGGAYSNHLHAVAHAGRRFGFETVGIVRGEAPPTLNNTLRQCRACGMDLHFISRKEYKQINTTAYIDQLKAQFGDVCVIPQGGSNALATRGCGELAEEINHQLEYPAYIATACGTGGTLAGMIRAAKVEQQLLGIVVLKGASALANDIELLPQPEKPALLSASWRLIHDYHFGGYAKIPAPLKGFVTEFNAQFGFKIEPIYTGKLFFGLFELVLQGYFEPGTRLVAVHTGGLQYLK